MRAHWLLKNLSPPYLLSNLQATSSQYFKSVLQFLSIKKWTLFRLKINLKNIRIKNILFQLKKIHFD